MRARIAVVLGLGLVSLELTAFSPAGLSSQSAPAGQSATVLVTLLERSVGRETFSLGQDGADIVFTSGLDLTDRDSRVRVSSTMRLRPDLTPLRFRVTGNSHPLFNVDADVQVTKDLPRQFFAAIGYAPLSARALLIRYWERQGRPARLRLVPGPETREAAIEFRGEDMVRAGDRTIRLRRYTVNGVVWGRESVWLDEQDRFAGLTTRIHMLPLDAVREDLKDALPALRRAAIADQMADLARMAGDTPAIAEGTFAIVGVTLIDGTDWPAIDDAAVVIRDGRILEAGPRSSVDVPKGINVVDARGKTVMPGLWDMHGHASQIEWAPAYLAAGVTSVRDMGGDPAFLTAFRDALAGPGTVGPRLFLGERANGAVPEAFGADHVTHLPLGGDPASPAVRDAIARLAKDRTVVDPALSWNELIDRAPQTAIESFEPGIALMPEPLAASYRSIRNKTDAASAAARRREAGAIVKALQTAGVPVVTGSEGAVPGFSVWRALELMVEAGLTPLEALQAATLVPAKAMRVDAEVGTIEPGKRADLLVLDANPLTDITYIRHLRYVITNGRMYHRDALWRSAGFTVSR